MKIKTGASLQGLQLRMRPVLYHANDIWLALGHELVVTSGTDGEHSASSYHYYGYALDLRTRFFDERTKLKAASMLIDKLGVDYDVVIESDHIHVEYDPF